MHVAELWRYPVKSMAGEKVDHIEVGPLGLADDRKILVCKQDGRIITSRAHPDLLGLKGTLGSDGRAYISGHVWDSPEALSLVRNAIGLDATLRYYEGPERFDVLPLLVASDGAISAFGHDSRRLRPNIIIGEVEGLAERTWPGQHLHIGKVIIRVQNLRNRCVMTTFDPDTLVQDLDVIRQIVQKFDGSLALNCDVVQGGEIRVGDAVHLSKSS